MKHKSVQKGRREKNKSTMKGFEQRVIFRARWESTFFFFHLLGFEDLHRTVKFSQNVCNCVSDMLPLLLTLQKAYKTFMK